MTSRPMDLIPPEQAVTLAGLFVERVRRTPSACAYRRFDRNDQCCSDTSWQEAQGLVGRWQEALRGEELAVGDRVAIMVRNGLDWIGFDLAALGLGLVTVPLYVNDRPENYAYIIEQTEARLLLIEGVEHWEGITAVHHRLGGLKRIVSILPACEGDHCDRRLIDLDHWLPKQPVDYVALDQPTDALASIVYTSGTTGHPKGVMLSHANLLANAWAGAQAVPVYPDDLFLSFLPLSHTLERTVGYYLPIMAGATVAHVRSLEKLADDLREVRPTLLVSVPRIYERFHQRISERLANSPAWKRRLFDLAVTVGWQRFEMVQGRRGWSPAVLLWPLLDRLVARPVRAALGGRVRLAISGGAPLNPAIARMFLASGVQVLQGYGLTETSPVVSVNLLQDNRPNSVGPPLPGVEVKLSASNELLVRGANLMQGYWQDAAATAEVVDADGWLHTGDLAAIEASGHIVITGRSKEIIVLANGEKIPPADMEQAIAGDHLFDQVMIVGEGRPFLAALVVLNRAIWDKLASAHCLEATADGVLDERCEEELLQRIAARLHAFPGYAQVRRVHLCPQPWEVADGLLTATLKLRRPQIEERYREAIETLYAGH
ncbi:MAG: long-chain fatty acid--CoA ligase [Desulfuromonadales bacterium]|nr:long-chain fatty acid--CoA ligase [Desulfuromonadales bacterium]